VPTNGTPWANGGGIATLARKLRYTWMLIVRKVDASQGLGPGPDGLPGVAHKDDNGNLQYDEDLELGWPGSDDTLADCGPNQSSGWIPSPASAPGDTLDDPARNLVSGAPVPAPVGPFDVTVIVFANRDFTSREPVYTNQVPAGGGLPAPIFVAGQTIATLFARDDGVPFPEIPIGTYIMDTTMDLSSRAGRRNGYIYRVVGKSLSPNGAVLTLSLDRPARATGWVLTVLRRAVAVFEKQVP